MIKSRLVVSLRFDAIQRTVHFFHFMIPIWSQIGVLISTILETVREQMAKKF